MSNRPVANVAIYVSNTPIDVVRKKVASFKELRSGFNYDIEEADDIYPGYTVAVDIQTYGIVDYEQFARDLAAYIGTATPEFDIE